MKQTKKQSLKETVISTFIGLAVSLLTQVVVFPLYNMEVSFNQNIQITIIFTLVSIVRGYFVRRYFNKNSHFSKNDDTSNNDTSNDDTSNYDTDNLH